MATTSPELIQATERFNNLFESVGMRVDPFEKAIGVSQGTIKSIRSGRNLISADCAIKIAKYLNISTDYLLCLSDEPTPLKTANIAERPTAAVSTELADLAQDERFVYSAKLYNAIRPEYRAVIYGYILGIATGLGLNILQILGK